MNKDFLLKQLNRFEILSDIHLEEYIDLVSFDDDCEIFERHHILPRSMFPEFIKDEWNIVKLSYSNHVKAHELLYKIYKNKSMACAYYFLIKLKKHKSDKVNELKRFYQGDLNPSKCPIVREKIRNAKLGVERIDMKGKKYFGADEKTIESIKLKSSEVHTNTVIVKDSNGKKFMISKDDERYLTGELVHFSKGVPRPNCSMKNKDVAKKQIYNRTENYKLFADYTHEKMLNYLLDMHRKGKKIFNRKNDNIGSNYVTIINIAKLNKNLLYNDIVQRLEKDNLKN